MLLAAKLHGPLVRPRLVHRARLTRRLTLALRQSGALVLISAPAGFGKTTLIGEWQGTRAGSRFPLAWLSLDEGDNDPSRFWAYLMAAFETLVPGPGGLVSPELEEPDDDLLPRFQELAAALGSGLSASGAPSGTYSRAERPAASVLVLDDYHLINTATLHAGMSYLIEHLPAGLRLLLLCRTDPALPLARWRARGLLAEIGAADLRFSPSEAGQFLKDCMGLRVEPARMAALAERAEGWAAGLQLTALSARVGRFNEPGGALASASQTRVFDYLAQEVFAQQPPDVQSLLLHTAVLEQMTPALCEAMFIPEAAIPGAVTPAGSGRAWLERLSRAQLFLVQLDEAGEWYRYHALMAEFLRARLSQGPYEQAQRLHGRASDWFAAAGNLGSAVDHALAAKDFERAADLLPQAIDEHLKVGQNLTALNWLKAMPEPLKRASPRLCLLSAWTLMLMRQLSEAEVYIQAATSLASTSNAVYGGEIALLRCEIALQRNQTQAAAALARQALTLLPASSTNLRALAGLDLGHACYQLGDLPGADAALTEAERCASPTEHAAIYSRLVVLLAPVRVMQGRSGEALRLLTAGLDHLPGRARLRYFQNLAHRLLAQIALERNDLAAAMEHAEQSLRLSPSANRALLGEALLLSAQVQLAAGQPQAAHACLTQAAATLASGLESDQRGRLAARAARLRLTLGQVSAAEQVFRPAYPDPPLYAVAFENFTLARLHLARRRFEAARLLLAHDLEAALVEGRRSHQAEALALTALACQGLADSAGAMAALEAALQLAEPAERVRLFLDEGAPMQSLLRAVLDQGRPGACYAARLLEAWPKGPFGLGGQPFLKPAAPLTGSELAVLRLMAAGRSNGEIAGQLTVSLNTVRSHSKNLFGKLEVHSRTQAAARARELGLL